MYYFKIIMEPIINIRGIVKKYDTVTAINGLSLAIDPGEMFAIVGPDGAGKTTLIRLLCGILKPDDGQISVLGYNPATQLNSIKPHIGYLSQKFSLYGDLSIDENIEFFAQIHKVSDYNQRRTQLLDFMRLAPYRTRLAEKLSGGMKQKLALACTLIHTPKIIFLDEPTTGVDPVSRRDFWKILSELIKSGITIVMTTPYLDEAERCGRVCMLNNGQSMITDNPDNIKKLMKGTVIEIVCDKIRDSYHLLKNTGFINEVQIFGDKINVVLQDKNRQFPEIQNLMMANNINITQWRVIPPSLENVFISLLKS